MSGSTGAGAGAAVASLWCCLFSVCRLVMASIELLLRDFAAFAPLEANYFERPIAGREPYSWRSTGQPVKCKTAGAIHRSLNTDDAVPGGPKATEFLDGSSGLTCFCRRGFGPSLQVRHMDLVEVPARYPEEYSHEPPCGGFQLDYCLHDDHALKY